MTTEKEPVLHHIYSNSEAAEPGLKRRTYLKDHNYFVPPLVFLFLGPILLANIPLDKWLIVIGALVIAAAGFHFPFVGNSLRAADEEQLKTLVTLTEQNPRLCTWIADAISSGKMIRQRDMDVAVEFHMWHASIRAAAEHKERQAAVLRKLSKQDDRAS